MTTMAHDETQNQPSTTGQTMINFPPIPLLSGDAFSSNDTTHTISTAEVVLTAPDGTTMRVPLEYRFGGWWLPADVPHA
jgi:hypothetical protein